VGFVLFLFFFVCKMYRCGVVGGGGGGGEMTWSRISIGPLCAHTPCTTFVSITQSWNFFLDRWLKIHICIQKSQWESWAKWFGLSARKGGHLPRLRPRRISFFCRREAAKEPAYIKAVLKPRFQVQHWGARPQANKVILFLRNAGLFDHNRCTKRFWATFE